MSWFDENGDPTDVLLEHWGIANDHQGEADPDTLGWTDADLDATFAAVETDPADADVDTDPGQPW